MGSGVDNSYISKLERKKVNITIDKMSIIAQLGVILKCFDKLNYDVGPYSCKEAEEK